MGRTLSPERLREARKEAGLQREQVAVELGLSLMTVGSYERGQTVPSAETLAQIADLYRVEDLESLFVETDDAEAGA
jgi:transcriptional regulator with XRE-family HTH domain